MKIRNTILIPGVLYISIVVTLLVLIIFLRDNGGTSIVILSIAGIISVLGGIAYFVFGIYYPLSRLRQKLNALAQFQYIEKDRFKTFHEFKDIDISIDNHLSRLNEIIHITNSLAEGKVVDDFEAVSDKDEIGHAMLRLKESIIKSNIETQKRRKIDEQQNWASRGFAKFGEMLRDFDQDVEKHSNLFIKELVAYLDMEVGGFFLMKMNKENEIIYELTGAYAFDREKKVKSVFKPGEGLIGRCALEKESIIITEIPKDYLKIRSGMGEDLPSTLLLVPVLFDDKVIGIIELATFSIVKRYKINFVESLGKSIGSSLSKAGILIFRD